MEIFDYEWHLAPPVTLILPVYIICLSCLRGRKWRQKNTILARGAERAECL